MNVYDIVKAATQLNLESGAGLTEEDLNKLPPGWQLMAKKYLDAVRRLNGKVVQLYYSKGTLQAKALGAIPEEDKVLEWLSAGMTRNSAAVCMISGEYGQRRRYYKELPCLADRFDYPFANELYEKEGYDAFEGPKPQDEAPAGN